MNAALLYVLLSVTLILFLSGLDDLVVDVLYMVRGRRSRRRLRIQDLAAVNCQMIALLIPTWREGAVIGDMLTATLDLVSYPRSRYHIFVGVYRNDPETQAAVDQVAARHPNIHKVVNLRPGPTSKAQHLNTLYRYLREYERQVGPRFDVVVLHAAGDVIHPTSFRLYNDLVPRYDMVQIPICPRQPPPTMANLLRCLTAGTYADEFAEDHARHMLVREWLGGFVPSAGVGTALARSALDRLAADTGVPFDPALLSGGYHLSLRLMNVGLRALYVLEAVERVDPQGRVHAEYITTRKTFPNTFRAAVRQKARWIYGITMQSRRWPCRFSRTVGQRYLLYSGSKASFTNLLPLPMCLILISWPLYRWLHGPFAVPSHLAWWLTLLLWANALLLVERLMVRLLAVKAFYGPREALLATMLPPLLPLRYLWCNLINLVATLRAWLHRLFGTAAGRRRRVKTDDHRCHAPSDLLVACRRRLAGQPADGSLTAGDLPAAPPEHRSSGTGLGDAPVRRVYLREDQVKPS